MSYNDTKVTKFSTYIHIITYILSLQKLKNNGNIHTYRKAKDHVVVLAVPESCPVSAFAVVPFMKLTLRNFYLEIQFVPKLDQV